MKRILDRKKGLSLIVVSVFVFCSRVLATETADSTQHFTIPEKKLLVSLFANIKSFDIQLAPQLNSDRIAQLDTFPINTSGVDISYAGLFAIALGGSSVSASETDIAERGGTRGSHIRFRFPWRSIYVEATYNQLTGFHSQRNERSLGQQSGYERFSDLSSESLAVRIIYAFSSHRYSLAAAFDQSEMQVESGGSWLVGLSSHRSRLSSGSPFVPTQLQNELGPEANITNADFAALSALGGYGYMFRFFSTGYIFGQLLGGLGFQRGRAWDSNGEHSARGTASSFRVDLGIGSNGPNYAYGFSISRHTNTNNTERTTVTFGDSSVRVHWGKRF